MGSNTSQLLKSTAFQAYGKLVRVTKNPEIMSPAKTAGCFRHTTDYSIHGWTHNVREKSRAVSGAADADWTNRFVQQLNASPAIVALFLIDLD